MNFEALQLLLLPDGVAPVDDQVGAVDPAEQYPKVQFSEYRNPTERPRV
jgi:hypothetical protein